MSPARSLRRSPTDGRVAGVCSGLARHADVDPLLVRVAAVLLALSGGIGLVLYAAGWLLVPDPQGRTVADEHLPAVRRWKRSTVIAAVALACVVLAGLLSSVAPFGLGSAFVLALIWYFGYYRNRGSRPGQAAGAPPTTRATDSADDTDPAAPLSPPSPPPAFVGPPTPFTEAASAWQRRVGEVRQRSVAPGPSPVPPWPVAPASSGWSEAPRAEQDRQQFLSVPDPVGLYGDPETAPTPAPQVHPRRSLAARRLRLSWLLVTGLVLAALAVADVAGTAVTTTTVLAAALLVTGLTLLLATFLGRARGVLPVAVLLTLALGASFVAAPVRSIGSWSDTTTGYARAQEIPVTQDVPGGHLEVDLTGLEVRRNQTYTVSIGTGHLHLVEPAGGRVRVEYTVETGAVDLPGDVSRTGRRLSGVVEPPGRSDPDEPVLTVRARVGVGLLEVTR